MSAACDLAVIGASFAGLACADSAARRGLSVLVLDRKPAPGYRMHTTGLLVKEVADKLHVPAHLTRTIAGVRLYAPNLKYADLDAPGYYFLATEIQGLNGPHPGAALEPHYPRFRLKRMMRRALDTNPPNALYNLLLGNPLFRAVAAEIYFHRHAMKSRQAGADS